MKQDKLSVKLQAAISDKQQRANAKSKRKRTLIRKAIEISKMCSLDILLIIKDEENKKIYQYNSGKSLAELFTHAKVAEAMKTGEYTSIMYTDSSYHELLTSATKARLREEQLA